MKSLSFTVSTKKGDIQQTRWLVVQSIPYPRINANGGQLRWENDEGKLWKQYQQPAKGIGQEYACYLLSPTCPEPPPIDFDRTIFAGYVPYQSYGKPADPANGGTIMFHKSSLGECSVNITPTWVTIKTVDGFQNPGKSEKAFFNEQIIPKLKEFIKENAAALKEEAIRKIKARLVSEVCEKRAELVKLEKLIDEAKF